MHSANEFNHHGISVKIESDDSPFDPRKDHETYTTVVAWHRRSDIGDEGFNYRDIADHMGESPDDLVQWLKDEHDAVCVLPLYLFEHGGQTISLKPFGDRWDSGQVGYVFVTQADLDTTGAPTPEGLIEGDVAEYDAFLRGEVYGYIVADGEDDQESCWGFIGDAAYCEEEAKAVAERIAERRAQEAAEASYWQARDVETVA